MIRDNKAQAEQFSRGMRMVEQLRHFSGPPAQFWPSLLEATSLLSGAELALLLRRSGEETKSWQRVAVWPPELANSPAAQSVLRLSPELANAADENQTALTPLNNSTNPNSANYGLALKLEVGSPQEGVVAVFYLPGFSEAQAASALRHLRLVADTPQTYRLQRAAGESQVKLSHFSSVLDLMALLNAQHRYLAVAMTLCNELAARHKCDRVSLGWLEGEYVKVQTISHTERFEKKMEAVRALEQTMEEALDQDELLVWPPPEGDSRINRDHGSYADDQKVKFLCTIPLRLGGETVAGITCERNSEAFGEDEQRLLSLCGEMAVRRLSELKRTDRWFGARLATASREKLAKVLGVQHTWAKVIAILVASGLAVLFFGRMNYRVEAPFILRTENVAILTAPFNGFIDEVPVEVGDLVQPGGVLLKLDTKDLLLEEASSLADLDRYTREAEKARANNSLAEMRIAEAQAEQARVRLELVRYRLSQATLLSPFAGAVIEGDLKKRIGAPLKQGDALFKVARTDRMYVECDVKEYDIHEVRGDATGEIAFLSRPKLKFPVKLERIEPAAQAKDEDNIFIVRCQFAGPVQDWWRPGMSGVAKINVGKRTFFWIISHRTIDFLRMFFWM
jgi:multidrug resistance efflux pump